MAFGKCPKCPATTRSGLLIGGECAFHYGGGGESERNVAPAVEKAKLLAAKTKTLKVWFDEQIRLCPQNCENCKQPIRLPADLTKRAAIAHIIPKRLIKSVATHELNRVFLCLNCHQNFDNKGNDHASSMPVAIIAKQRFKEFRHLIIAPDEVKHIPAYLNI